jgi:hypothetical protein
VLHRREGLKEELTQESRAKISAALKGRTLSDETRAKMSAARKGRTHFQDEAKAKIGAAHKGKVYSAETRAKMSAANKGMIWINNGSKTRIISWPRDPRWLGEGKDLACSPQAKCSVCLVAL